jgi:hypothetical protein
VEENVKVLYAKLLILCGVTKVVETRYEIFELCLQTSALSSHHLNITLNTTYLTYKCSLLF